MPMYASLLKEKFPQDEANGLFRVPNLPATRLGKLLLKFTRISSPSDVVAMHQYSGTFSSGVLLFTKDRCYYDGGAFALEDVRETQVKGSKLTIFVNQQNQFVPHQVSVKNEQVAQTLKRILDSIANHDPQAEALVNRTYEGFSGGELDWLKLRDEVMRTIDMLYERYNDGKLSILDYEEKKEELLGRL
ncbi:MAG: hypothetical protein OHK0039_42300 [Bacteroidia bacterium]